jgi:hypothetical protein
MNEQLIKQRTNQQDRKDRDFKDRKNAARRLKRRLLWEATHPPNELYPPTMPESTKLQISAQKKRANMDRKNAAKRAKRRRIRSGKTKTNEVRYLYDYLCICSVYIYAHMYLHHHCLFFYCGKLTLTSRLITMRYHSHPYFHFTFSFLH